MNSLKRAYWINGFLPLIIVYLLTGIIVLLFFNLLAGEQCQFTMERKIFAPDCFYNSGGCPEDVGRLGCPKFVEAKYYTLGSLVLVLPVFLVVWSIWTVIRVFIASKSATSWKTKLGARVSVIIAPFIFIILFIPYIILLALVIDYGSTVGTESIPTFDNMTIWGGY